MMAQELIDLKDLEMSEEELFAPEAHDNVESEKITAPRYSYWRSVFRVFFSKKLNIFILYLLSCLRTSIRSFPVLTVTQTSWILP